MKQLPPVARTYWQVVVAVGVLVTALSADELVRSFPHLGIRVLLAATAFVGLGILAERMVIPLTTFEPETASHSIGSVAVIAAIVVLPWYVAILVAAVAVGLTQARRSVVKAFFNTGHVVVSVAAAALLFRLVGGAHALQSSNGPSLLHAFAAMMTLALVYYVAGSLIVAAMVAMLSHQKIWQVYQANHLKTVLQEATSIGLGLMLGGFWLYLPAFAPLVGLPVVMAYFSIETFVRIQQETRQSVLAMSESIDHRDPLTYNHSKRVARLSVALAEAAELSHEQIANIELSALVHDIGKIGIPSEILMKPGKLTPEERAQMELHPIIGYDMLRHYKQFRKGLGIVRWHHETWDGTGYPDRLPGHKIPLEARIVCIADAYEAMTADRPYRKAMSAEIAFERLEKAAGSQFDPNLVPLFRQACEAIGEVGPAEETTVATPEVEPPHRVFDKPAAIPLAVPTPYRRHKSLRRLPASAGRCRQPGVTLQPEPDA